MDSQNRHNESVESPESLISTSAKEGLRSDRLGIKHLLLWTGFTAALLAINRTELSEAANAGNGVEWAKLGGTMASTILWGAGLATLLVLVWRRLRAQRAFKEPGHGLLLLAVGIWVANLLGDGNLPDFNNGLTANEKALIMLLAVRWTLLAGVIFASGYWISRERRWRLVFLLCAASCLRAFAEEMLHMFHKEWYWRWILHYSPSSVWDLSIILAALFVVLVMDVAMGVRRGWTHWVGVCTIVGTYFVPLLWWALTPFRAHGGII